MVGVSIEKLIFNDGTEVEVNPTDIVVFVGPNNAGKSRSLKDIFGLLSLPQGSIVVRDVVRRLHQVGEIKNRVTNMSTALMRSDQTCDYYGYNYNIYQRQLDEIEMRDRLREGIRAFLVSNVKTEERLGTADPKEVPGRGQAKQNPLQYMTDKDIRNSVSEVFQKIFNQYVYCYDKATNKLYLHIGPKIEFDQNGLSADQISDTYYQKMDELPKLNEQGDGIRSLAGLLMNVMMPNYSMYLIDEPEAFLHPPQARTLGSTLPELLVEKQTFISTHSIDLIKGLLTAARDRIKIVRITRNEDENHIKKLEDTDINIIWNDPIMRHSNMLDGLFYEHTVLCESDSDCQLYSLILEYEKEQAGQRSDTLFIHCGGKGRMHLIIKELRALGIDYRVIPDLDVFNDRILIRRIVENSGGNWAAMQEDYDILFAEMNMPDGTMNPDEFMDALRQKIANRGITDISKTEAKKIGNDAKDLLDNQWDKLKKQGEDYIQDQRIKEALGRLITELNRLKVYPVKAGELENFIHIPGMQHGPGWAMGVIEAYPDFGNVVYDKVKEFVRSWGL